MMLRTLTYNLFLLIFILIIGIILSEITLRVIITLNIIPKNKILDYNDILQMKWYNYTSRSFKNPAGKQTKYHSIKDGYFLNPIDSKSFISINSRPFVQNQIFTYHKYLGWTNVANYKSANNVLEAGAYETDKNGYRITNNLNKENFGKKKLLL